MQYIIKPIVLLLLWFVLVKLVNGNFNSNAFNEAWSIAILLMIIGKIFIEYLYEKPRDAVVNSLNAFIIALTFFYNAKLIVLISYSLLIFISGTAYLLIQTRYKQIYILSKVSTKLGKANVIFPIIVLLYFLNFDIVSNQSNFNYINLGWFILFMIAFLIITSKKFSELFNMILPKSRYIGRIRTNLWPNIVLVNFNVGAGVKINDLLYFGPIININEEFKNEKIGLIIDFIGSESENKEVTARVFLMYEPQRDLDENKTGLQKIESECYRIDNPDKIIEKADNRVKYYWKRRKGIIGLVSNNSTIDLLKVETVRYQQLHNAELVSIINKYEDRPIRYQIIEAETYKETEDKRGDIGYTNFYAYQLGEWGKPRNENDIEDKTKFSSFFEFQWVPDINTPVFKWQPEFDEINLQEKIVNKDGYFLLGNIPKTKLPIYVNVKELVSHHTAILGITGSGKSTLVFKILKEVIKNDILPICIDITGEYKNKIENTEKFFDEPTKNIWKTMINEINEANKKSHLPYGTDSNRITKEECRDIEVKCIAKIIKSVQDRIIQLRKIKKIVLFELLEISNTKNSIDSTQYIIQGILEYAKYVYEENLKKTSSEKDSFQICLVLEEAHTLIPENIGVGGYYSDSQVVIDKISQIALQGRKYNVGFILISQRTATVKKTILNQCNTMLSFRAYDKTSFDFLENYYGEKYVKEIIHLKNHGSSRHILLAGKAVVADRPLIVEIKE